MISSRLQAAFAVALVLPAPLSAASYLIEDLNPGPSVEIQSVHLRGLASGPDGVSYFSASDPAYGTELWRSDGTPAGTWRVTDVCAGRCSSNPSPGRVFHGGVFFSADDGFSGSELWVTDGTPGGERRVRDLCPGPCSSSPSFFEEAGGNLFFFAWNGPRLHLWTTDGTREGTVRLRFICAVSHDPNAFCDPYPGLFPAGDRAFFFGKAGSHGLWVTDGTVAGTRLFKEVFPGGLAPDGIYLSVIPGPGFAWIWTEDGLWRSDGTAAGTHRLMDTDSNSKVIVWNGLLFGVTYGGIIRSDGTPEGTYRLSVPSSGYVNDVIATESGILFSVAASGSSYATSLWRSRGTEDTTVQVIDLAPGWISDYDIKSLGDRAIFGRTLDYDHPPELWTTDGTAAGTRKLDLPERPRNLDGLFPAGRQAYFLRSSEPWAPDDLWVSDGGEAGTRRVRDFRVAPGSSGPLAQTAVRNQLLFSAQAGGESAPLFLTDGTAVGTHVVSTDASWASAFTRLGHRLLFQVEERSRRHFSLWETDGTAAGTVQVVPNFYGLHGAVAFGGSLYWPSFELMKTDGTARGTVQVKDIDPYRVDTGLHHECADEGSYPRPALVLNNRLLLTANDGKHGRELWTTDGTPQGTHLFFDLNPLRSLNVPAECIDDYIKPRNYTGFSSDPEGFVALGDIALFSAADGKTGRELWRTDGVPYHTHRVVDLRPGLPGSAPHDLVAFHGLVYFFASAEGTGEALWSTNGTGRGTKLVSDLALAGSPSWGRDLMVAGDRLFFVVFNETTGAELWVSGGDAVSTMLVRDLNPGPANASPRELTNIDGLLVFAADDGLTGLEPWRSDGTPAGTFPLADLAPGPDASSPGPFTRIRKVLITGADDGARGREPWAIPLGDVLRP